MQVLTDRLKLLFGVHCALRVVVESALLPIWIEISILVMLFVAGFGLVVKAFRGGFAFLLLFSIAFVALFVPVNTEGLKLVDGHQDFGELSDLAQLLGGRFFFLSLELSFLAVDLFELSVELRDLVV